MQGVERADREFLDAVVWAGHLVPAGSMFAFLAAHRAEVFPDREYADLFAPAGRGRPSWPATQMAAVMTLQALHAFSDRETAEAVRFDVRWKVAIGAALDERGFDPSTLVYWRRRIAASARPHRVNEAVRRIAEGTGVLAGRRRRVADSTLLEDAVATQDTVTQLAAAVRKVMREVPGAAERAAAVCASGHDYSVPKRPSCDWSDPAAREALVSGLVSDANALVAAVDGPGLDEEQAQAVALLALIAGQDVEPAEGSDGTDGRWRIARPQEDKGRGAATGDRVISVTDPQARHSRKNVHDRTDGYRAHIAAEPQTGIITDEELTMAAGQDNSDAATAARFVARAHGQDDADHAGRDEADRDEAARDEADDAARDDADGAGRDDAGQDEAARDNAGEALTWYADSAYGTGDLLAAIARRRRQGRHQAEDPPPRPGPGPVHHRRLHPRRGRRHPDLPRRRHPPHPPRRHVSFGTACRACPLAARCVTPKKQARGGRAIHLHPRDKLLRAARRDWAASKDLRKDYSKTRPNVERLIAQVATHRGRRLKLRYHGTTANHAWLKTRTAALNLRNLIGKGLTRDAAGWHITWQPAT